MNDRIIRLLLCLWFQYRYYCNHCRTSIIGQIVCFVEFCGCSGTQYTATAVQVHHANLTCTTRWNQKNNKLVIANFRLLHGEDIPRNLADNQVLLAQFFYRPGFSCARRLNNWKIFGVKIRSVAQMQLLFFKKSRGGLGDFFVIKLFCVAHRRIFWKLRRARSRSLVVVWFRGFISLIINDITCRMEFLTTLALAMRPAIHGLFFYFYPMHRQ